MGAPYKTVCRVCGEPRDPNFDQALCPAHRREAERIAAALERQLQSGRAPGMADQWRVLRWIAQGAA